LAFVDAPDFAANEFYGTASRHGFAKLELSGGFGQDAYQAALYLRYLRQDSGASDPGEAAARPDHEQSCDELYGEQRIAHGPKAQLPAGAVLSPHAFRPHREASHTDAPVYLLPRFAFQYDNQTELSEAEFYIGVQGLAPPQNLALLFEVADGTANPLVKKPERSPLVFWSYLSNNEWIAFAEDEVQDGSGELLNSGVVSFALPRQATTATPCCRPGCSGSAPR
jgi:hypothetical protein